MRALLTTLKSVSHPLQPFNTTTRRTIEARFGQGAVVFRNTSGGGKGISATLRVDERFELQAHSSKGSKAVALQRLYDYLVKHDMLKPGSTLPEDQRARGHGRVQVFDATMRDQSLLPQDPSAPILPGLR